MLVASASSRPASLKSDLDHFVGDDRRTFPAGSRPFPASGETRLARRVNSPCRSRSASRPTPPVSLHPPAAGGVSTVSRGRCRDTPSTSPPGLPSPAPDPALPAAQHPLSPPRGFVSLPAEASPAPQGRPWPAPRVPWAGFGACGRSWAPESLANGPCQRGTGVSRMQGVSLLPPVAFRIFGQLPGSPQTLDALLGIQVLE